MYRSAFKEGTGLKNPFGDNLDIGDDGGLVRVMPQATPRLAPRPQTALSRSPRESMCAAGAIGRGRIFMRNGLEEEVSTSSW